MKRLFTVLLCIGLAVVAADAKQKSDKKDRDWGYLDEITSALDMDTEQRVLQYLMNLGITCIISTHRPSVLSMCTRAYRLEEGRLTQLSEEEIWHLTAAM